MFPLVKLKSPKMTHPSIHIVQFYSVYSSNKLLFSDPKVSEHGQVQSGGDDWRGLLWQGVQGHLQDHRGPGGAQAHTQGIFRTSSLQ